MHKLEQGDTQFVSKMKQIVCPLVPILIFFSQNIDLLGFSVYNSSV